MSDIKVGDTLLAWQLANNAQKVKSFKVKNGFVIYRKIYVNGDKKRVCIQRRKQYVWERRYIKPHTELEVISV